MDRFGRISVRQGRSIVQCCKDAGISRSLFYEIRDGNRAISDKVWAKLENAERAAGLKINAPCDTLEGSNSDLKNAESVVRDGKVKYPASRIARKIHLPEFKLPPEFEKLDKISAMVSTVREEFDRKIQEAVGDFPMAELIARMDAANAWPPSAEDAELSPALLMIKYQPP